MDNTDVLKYFSGDILKALSASKADISEIRLRAEKPLAVTINGGYCFLNADGKTVNDPVKAVRASSDNIKGCFEAMCRYSVHSFQKQINQGFITTVGGHRAGISGTAVYSSDGKIENVRNISSINFRIAKEVKGSADGIINRIMSRGLKSVLICGKPCSGKTTILRDMCRSIGNKYPIALIDERGELAAVSSGRAYNDIGEQTDIFNGFSKADGIITAIRAMSPRMIICDEIGSSDDARALRLAALSGVKAAATVHCSSPEELLLNKQTADLIKDGIFQYVVFVSSRSISAIYCSNDLIASVCGAEV